MGMWEKDFPHYLHHLQPLKMFGGYPDWIYNKIFQSVFK